MSSRPLAERENKLQNVKVQGEISSLGDEISKMWKVIGELEGKKSPPGPSDDPSSFGELAKAINAQMAAGNTATTSGPRNVFAKLVQVYKNTDVEKTLIANQHC